MTETTTTELATTEAAPQLITVDFPAEELARIDAVAAECGLIGGKGGITEVLRMARGVQMLREMLTDKLMSNIMALMGTRIGFKTDRDSGKKKDGTDIGPYTVKQVRDVTIEAFMRGARMVGNEVNVIAFGCYLTKEYFTRVLKEYPDFANLRMVFTAPELAADKSAFRVGAVATWTYKGVPDELRKMREPIPDTEPQQFFDSRIVVRNQGDFTTADLILGKAERKLRAEIWKRLTSSDFQEGEVGEDVEPGTARPTGIEGVVAALAGNQSAALPAPQQQSTFTHQVTPEKETVTVQHAQPAQQQAPQKAEEPGPLFKQEQFAQWQHDTLQRLDRCKTLKMVTDVEAQTLEFCHNDTDRKWLGAVIEARRQQIRSNGSK